MKTKHFFNLSMDEIVFDERNKQYGAFELRQHYGSALLKAVGMALSAFLLALLILSLMNKLELLRKELEAAYKRCQQTIIDSNPIEPVLPPEIAKPSGQQPPAELVGHNNNMVPVNRNNEQHPDTAAYIPAGNNTGEVPGQGGLGSGTITMTQPSLPVTPSEPKPSFHPGREEMPEFNGGDLGAWIEEHLVHPGGDIEAMTRVHFVIDETGQVKDITIIQSSGYKSFDNEAVKVIKKLSGPGFKPGKQRGIPVPVSYEIPISFSLEE